MLFFRRSRLQEPLPVAVEPADRTRSRYPSGRAPLRTRRRSVKEHRPDGLEVGAALAVVLAAIGVSATADVAKAPALSARAAPEERPRPAASSERSSEEARDAYAKLALAFVPNAGQTDARARFSAQTAGASFYFTRKAAVLSLRPGAKDGRRGAVLRLAFLGANPDVEIEGRRRGRATVNYLLGNDASAWHTGLPTYGALVYRELWPGIDMVFRGAAGRLKYEFVLRPGARVRDIRLAYRGARRLSVTRAGALAIATRVGVLRDERPRSYQRVGGRRVRVESSFRLARGAYGFAVGRYNGRRTLVIDPGLRYSTYLGGGSGEGGHGIAIDAAGNAYVTGQTYSSDFPTTVGTFDTTLDGESDAFVTKINPRGSALVYSTYFGGRGVEFGTGIAVDRAGSAYVTGTTGSRDLPTTAGAFDTTLDGWDAFVTKLDPRGSGLVYSTYLGGRRSEFGEVAWAIAVDRAGSAYVTGSTGSNFPTTAGAFDRTYAGGLWSGDAFVTKLNRRGSALIYSTYLGGGLDESGAGIAVAADGSAYVTGRTESSDFPTTAGAFDRTFTAGVWEGDAFVTKLDPRGSALVYSTYLGGRRSESGYGISVDAAGSAYATGSTDSRNFPTTPGAFDRTFNGWAGDAFVTKLNRRGSALVYSTYLGGRDGQFGSGIAVDAAGNAYVTGATGSRNFPTTSGAFAAAFNGGAQDAFVTKLDWTGSDLLYSTYLGGSDDEFEEFGRGIAVDAIGRAYVTGVTGSSDFPTTPGAFDMTFNGGVDAFVTRLDLPVAECGRVTLARRTGRAGVRMVVRVRVLDREGRPLAGVRVTARGAGVRTAAQTGRAGYARLGLRPRRAGFVTIRAGSRAACVRRIRVVGTVTPPPLTGRPRSPRSLS